MFVDAPERMIRYGKISVDVMKFIMQRGWPLTRWTMNTKNDQVEALFDDLYQEFRMDHFTRIGELLAEIAWILEDPANHQI